jgi:hypothetical protein
LSGPFDETRYRGLLEGLEAVEVTYEYAVIQKERIDSESFDKIGAAYSAKLARVQCECLESLAKVSDGNHLSIAEDFSLTDGVRYLRGQDISSDMMLDDENPVFIPEHEYLKLSRSHVRKDDVLVTIVGANTGLTALVFEAPSKLTANCKLGILRARKEKNISPAYIHAFLAGKFGQHQILQAKRGAGQTGLILPDLKRLKIPRFSDELERVVAEVSYKAHAERRTSKNIMKEAEQTLLGALGLLGWQPPEKLNYERKASEAFAAGRLDAEYFSPRVQHLIALLEKHGEKVGDVAELRKEYFSPWPHRNFEYIEIGDVGSDGTVSSNTVWSGEAASRATWHVRTGDILTSTVRPVRRLSAIIKPEQNGFVCSSGFAVLKPVSIAPEVLLVYLRLPPIAQLMDLHTTASLYPAISVPDILALPFARPSETTEKLIVEAIHNAHGAKQKAGELLDRAKRAVEIAIETGESAALDYLHSVNRQENPT